MRVVSAVSGGLGLCVALLACAGAVEPVAAVYSAAGASPNATMLAPVAAQVQAGGATTKPGENCDLTVEGPLCMMANRRVLLPSAAPAHLAGHWTFDDAWPTDSSGNGLHASTPAAAGIGVAHVGFSASLDRAAADFVPVQVPDEGGRLVSADSTTTFWLFVVRPPQAATGAGPGGGGGDCAVVLKGNLSSTAVAKSPGSPGVFLSAAKASPSSSSQSQVSQWSRLAFVANRKLQRSRARVAAGRWTHVAVVRYASETSLYVNGVLDAKVPETSPDKTAEGPLILGGVPRNVHLLAEGAEDGESVCGRVHVLLDEVRLYTAALPAWAIEAEASPALGGVSPRFARLGCAGCSRAEAADSCDGSYHLCTETELFSGALQVGRALGYVDASTANVWRGGGGGGSPSSVPQAGVGVGLCCSAGA
jgi:hypothetical protein